MNKDLKRYTRMNLKRSFYSNLSVNAQILILNIVFFIAVVIYMIFSSYDLNSYEFWKYIAINPSNILAGKYLWTFISSMFMHAGFLHLFVNMISLLFVGSLVEKLIGKKRYLLFYLASGIFAGLFFIIISYLTGQGLDSYAVGASGALFALVGFLMLITPNLPVYIMFIPIPIKMKYAAPLMLVVLWLISFAADIPIGNTAHFGGLLAGLLYGLYVRNKYKRKSSK